MIDVQQNRFPDICKLSARLIVKLHKALRMYSPDLDLSHDSLPLFLELSHDRATSGDHQDDIDTMVKLALRDIRIMNKANTLTTWTTADNKDRAATAASISGVVQKSILDIINSVAILPNIDKL